MERASHNDPPGDPPKPTTLWSAGGGSASPVGAPASGGSGGNDLTQAITVLRPRIDEEFRITERLDTKSRQGFALATGFFVVVQTVAFGGFAQTTVNPTEPLRSRLPHPVMTDLPRSFDPVQLNAELHREGS